MRVTTRPMIFLGSLAITLGMTTWAYTHDPNEAAATGDSTVYVESTHPDQHGIEQLGDFHLDAIHFPEDKEGIIETHEINGRNEPLLTKPMKAAYALNILVAVQNLEGTAVLTTKRMIADPPRFSPSVELDRPWMFKGPPKPCDAVVAMTVGGDVVLLEDVEVGHLRAKSAPQIEHTTSLLEDTLSGRFVVAFERDANDDLVLDNDGDPILDLDSNGRLQFEDASQPILRVTSEVIDGPSSRTVRYTLQNFTDLDRTFSFSSITSSSHPNGWAGTVDADDTATLDVVVPLSETIYGERSLCTTLSEDPVWEDVDDEATFLAWTLVPESELECSATVTLDSAVNTPAIGNEIDFTVSDAPAEWAILLRVDSAGDGEIVDELETTLLAGMQYELVDETPPTGTNSYTVYVGVGFNYHASDDDSIQN